MGTRTARALAGTRAARALAGTRAARALAGRGFLGLALLLSACETTTILESENPSVNRPPAWTDYWSLPVEIHGAVPGLQLATPPAAGRRVVMFLNPAVRPANGALCAGAAPGAGVQAGRYAFVVGALCNGPGVVTFATADILTAGLSEAQVRGHLEMLHLQLWQALTYGNNHPELRHPSWMYGN